MPRMSEILRNLDSSPKNGTPVSAPSQDSSTVIIVEDDADLLHSLGFSLELEGWPVVAYETAEDLLAGARLPEKGCLVLDQILPGTSGLELLSQLRDRGVTLPAVIITTNPAPQLRIMAAAQGAGIVEKPLLGPGLIEAIRKALTEH
jgi:FixJ family two-component response regulator